MSTPTPQDQPPQETLTFPATHASLILPYLPPSPSPSSSPPTSSTTPSPQPKEPAPKEERPYPHLTLTYAHSLDASLALAPGVRTALSGPQSKAMTHFLRTRHDAILVGAGTAVADDPGLNSRLVTTQGEMTTKQPRPVVLDPRGRWDVREGSKVIGLAREGKGLGPWVVVAGGTVVDEGRKRVLEGVGGRYITLEARGEKGRFEWADVLGLLKQEGVGSVMVEGGGEVINSLLAPAGNGFVDAVVVTIAPTWLGPGGVMVSPPRAVGEDGRPAEQVRLTDVTWCPLGEDVVLCGRIAR
ncbi:dihydrofolate reductase-like domain-containing protein [Parachaetomium inaequale]|uniref:2,5-diamino-6-ribosylamino-4(3H)-pyrimidinone 5'-phosphate reductase n=1 Tax=Parachaetomium inaequale TaxID=2588326 RepID=A0AAN6P6C9_9PEZI|nr:dihydrofolate reductase-like domain-containing protein [Parachaetomium inaequale]